MSPSPPPPSNAVCALVDATGNATTTTTVGHHYSAGIINPSLPSSSLNHRFSRSYSEEFMSSSEERERSAQFYGGTYSSLNNNNNAVPSGTGPVNSIQGSSRGHRVTPVFSTDNLPLNVTISEGSAFVHLPCRVKQLGERTVSERNALIGSGPYN